MNIQYVRNVHYCEIIHVNFLHIVHSLIIPQKALYPGQGELSPS